MPDDRKRTTHKAPHAVALTRRQQKSAGRQEFVARTARSKEARRGGLSTLVSWPDSGPLDVTEVAVREPLMEAPEQVSDPAATRQPETPVASVEPAPAPDATPTQATPGQPAAQQPVKVRVRRKRAAPPSVPADVTLADTTILPTIRIIRPHAPPSEAAPEPPAINTVRLISVDGATSDAPQTPIWSAPAAPEHAAAPAAEPVSTQPAPPEPERPPQPEPQPLEEPAADQISTLDLQDTQLLPEPAPQVSAETPAAVEDVMAPEPQPPDITPEPEALSPEAPQTLAIPAPPDVVVESPTEPAESIEPVAPEQPEQPQQTPHVEDQEAPRVTRKLPTLAVMAALAAKSEIRGGQRETESPNDAAPTPPASPEPEPSAEIEPQPAQDTPLEAAPAEESVDTPDADSTAPSLMAVQAPAPEPPHHEMEQPEPEDEPSQESERRMWWMDARRSRTDASAPTPPRGASDFDITAPRAAIRKGAANSARSKDQGELALESGATARWQPADTRRSADSSTRRATASVSLDTARTGALIWAGGAQVTLAGTAALVAVIALLRGSAGPMAVEIFGWALSFAILAGLGAWLGYLAWQTTRPRLAALALLLSQIGLFVWALDLLGPRAALLALAPVSVALALRALGRIAASLTVGLILMLYIADLALTMSGVWAPAREMSAQTAALVDTALLLAGLWLTTTALISLYTSHTRAVARAQALAHAARLAASDLDTLRASLEDDSDALRRTLALALRGDSPDRVSARGALSPVAEQINATAERLVELSHERSERKRLESAARRLTRTIERAWLGLPWSWPEPTGTLLDDLIALLRTPPPPDSPHLLDDTTPTGQALAPHLFRSWQPESPPARQTTPSPWPDQSAPSQPSGIWPSLWSGDPVAPDGDPLALPPAPRWRGPRP